MSRERGDRAEQPRHDDESAAAVVARWSEEEPGGVLVQTTHWRHIEFSTAVYWAVACSFLVYVAIGGFAPDTAPRGERIAQLVLVSAGVLPVLAWWGFVRSRTGVIVGPDGLVARRIFRADVPLDPASPPQPVPVSSGGRRTAIGAHRGFSLPGSHRRALPGIRAYAKPMTDLRACRLIIRPARPWYRPAARFAIPSEILWAAGTDGRDVLRALGFALLPEPEPEPRGRHGETAAERLERWNRNPA